MRIPDYSTLRLLVAGDVMLDRYWTGSTTRISPEAPVPVVNIRHVEHRAGGAANVALGLRALGAAVELMGRVGADDGARTLAQLLGDAGVQCRFEEDASRSTIVKLRVLSHHQQMIRLDFEDAPDASASLPVQRFEPLLGGMDAVVLSDYGKGALFNVPELIGCCRRAGRPVLVDPKQADFSVYRGATAITPNRHEFERAAGLCRSEQELVDKGQALLEQMEWQALLITRGEEGMTLLERGASAAHHIPARAREVYDVTGAGDTVIAVLAACVAAGLGWQAAAELANLGAAVAVGKVGTAAVTLAELAQAAREADAAPAPGRA
jgi:D-beta-D-heptose 7-phosphate kinase/D-beta-D-heptose 1-phosphate adenosyltransferase